MARCLAALAVVFAVTVSPVVAETLKVGEACPTFAGLDCACGATASLEDMKKDVLVVCITCNHCPAAVAYEDRMIAFCKKYTGENGKVDFVAINVNNGEADKLPAMKVRSEQKGFNFMYAYDPSQKIAKELGAKRTPEFFVFDKARKLVYTGAFDDNNNAAKATECYLEQAVEAALNGSTPPKSTQARGCGIRFDN